MHPLVRADDARSTTTPNATMTTLASPSTAGSSTLSLWTVEMDEGATGPRHTFDSEQIWSLLDGHLDIAVGGVHHELHPGDTLVIAPHVERQISATVPSRAVVCGEGAATVTAAGSDAPAATPPWIA